jgi:hypothetical protein
MVPAVERPELAEEMEECKQISKLTKFSDQNIVCFCAAAVTGLRPLARNSRVR